MTRFLGVLLCLALFTSLASAETMRIFAQDNMLMLPLRYVAQWMGVGVAYEARTDRTILDFNGNTIALKTNSAAITVNGREYKLDRPVTRDGGTTYVPAPFVAQAFGAPIALDKDANAFAITHPRTQQRLLIPGWLDADTTFTPLHLDVYNGFADRVRADLRDGDDVNTVDTLGRTPLHWAAQANKPAMVDLLCSYGAKLNLGDARSQATPLLYATDGAHIDVVRKLLERQADVNAHTTDGTTALVLAAARGYVDHVKVLLNAGASTKAATDASGNSLGKTPLNTAAAAGQVAIVKLLLDAGAPVTAAGQETPPLIAAVQGEQMAILNALLDAGSPVAATMPQGKMQAIHFAAARGRVDMVKTLVTHGATLQALGDQDQSPLHVAAQFGQAEMVAYLLEQGGEVGRRTSTDDTPLHLAAGNGDRKTVVALLDARADANAKNKDGETPLHVAARAGNREAADALLWRGAAIDARESKGFTPLQSAVYTVARTAIALAGQSVPRGQEQAFEQQYQNRKATIAMLLTRGADVNAQSDQGTSALHLVVGDLEPDTPVLRELQEMIWLLMDHKADINNQQIDPRTKEKTGYTPLQMAIRRDNRAMVEFLLRCGADLSRVAQQHGENTGYSPLQLALQSSALDVARFLIARGADVNAPVVTVTVAQPGPTETRTRTTAVVDTPLTLALKSQPRQPATEAAPQPDVDRAAVLQMVKLLLDKGADPNAVLTTRTDTLKPAPPTLGPAAPGATGDAATRETVTDTTVAITDTVLSVAAARTDRDVVNLLLERGAKPDAKLKDDRTVLHVAARAGKGDIVLALHDHGADLNALSASKQTPLAEALNRGQRDVAVLLLARGANAALADAVGVTPLHLAAQRGQRDMVKLLTGHADELTAEERKALTVTDGQLKAAAAMVGTGLAIDLADQTGNTPLLAAARNGWDEMVQYLVDKGADVKHANANGETALHLAASWGNLETMTLLLTRGADAKAATQGGVTALHIVAGLDNARLVEQRWKQMQSQNPAPTEKAQLTPVKDLVALLLQWGADRNAATTAGVTPLHEAVLPTLQNAANRPGAGTTPRDPEPNVAALLGVERVNVNAVTQNGRTPLHLAAERGELGAARLLLSKGADLKAVDTTADKNTPYDLAVLNHQQAMAEYLLSAEAAK